MKNDAMVGVIHRPFKSGVDKGKVVGENTNHGANGIVVGDNSNYGVENNNHHEK